MSHTIRTIECPYGTTPAQVVAANPGYYHIFLDIGGSCMAEGWERAGEATHQTLVFDHHFAGAAFPSACAAVFWNASAIQGWAANLPEDSTIQIVLHRGPDFDALAARFLCLYLLNTTIDSHVGDLVHLLRRGRDARAANWFDFAGAIEAAGRAGAAVAWAESGWTLALAQFASCVDQCKPLPLPRHRRLSAVLYAMLHLRPFSFENVDALFGHMVEQWRSRGLHPAFNDVFTAATEAAPFAAVLEVLDTQEAAYRRDLARARITQVRVPCAGDDVLDQATKVSIDVWHELDRKSPQAGWRNFDGVYIRDPECLLFKEFAREDTEDAALGTGFVFTMVARSGAIQVDDTRSPSGDPGPANESRYWISLDPEKCDSAHLYHVWSALQLAENGALRRKFANAPGSRPVWARGTVEDARKSFESRTEPGEEWLLNDPWFDGHSYRFTIVDTPGRGTLLREGHRPDLSDDEVAALVQHTLELSMFNAEGLVYDFPRGSSQPTVVSFSPAQMLSAPATLVPAGDQFRLARIDFKDAAFSIDSMEQAARIGRLLWKLIEPHKNWDSVPGDFEQNHLVVESDRVSVWNHFGVATAAIPSGVSTDLTRRLHDAFGQISRISSLLDECHELLERPGRNLRVLVGNCRSLTQALTELAMESARPQERILKRFLEGIGMVELGESVSDLVEQISDEHQTRRDQVLQLILAIGTGLGLSLAWLQVVGISSLPGWPAIFGVSFLVLFTVPLPFLFRNVLRRAPSRSRTAAVPKYRNSPASSPD